MKNEILCRLLQVGVNSTTVASVSLEMFSLDFEKSSSETAMWAAMLNIFL